MNLPCLKIRKTHRWQHTKRFTDWKRNGHPPSFFIGPNRVCKFCGAYSRRELK